MDRDDIVNLIKEISNSNPIQCMLCGKCSGRCPNFDNLDIKPHQFVNLLNKKDVDSLFSSKTLNTCLTCLACVEVCPRKVAPANIINAVRELACRKESILSTEKVGEMIEDDMPQQLIVTAFRKFF